MTWRPLEKELIDIIKREGFDVNPDHNSGDHYLSTNDVDELNITELAKNLARRGIGQGTPR